MNKQAKLKFEGKKAVIKRLSEIAAEPYIDYFFTCHNEAADTVLGVMYQAVRDSNVFGIYSVHSPRHMTAELLGIPIIQYGDGTCSWADIQHTLSVLYNEWLIHTHKELPQKTYNDFQVELLSARGIS